MGVVLGRVSVESVVVFGDAQSRCMLVLRQLLAINQHGASAIAASEGRARPGRAVQDVLECRAIAVSGVRGRAEGVGADEGQEVIVAEGLGSRVAAAVVVVVVVVGGGGRREVGIGLSFSERWELGASLRGERGQLWKDSGQQTEGKFEFHHRGCSENEVRLAKYILPIEQISGEVSVIKYILSWLP